MGEVWHNLRLVDKSILENQDLVGDSELKRVYVDADVVRKLRNLTEETGLVKYSYEKFPSNLPITKEPVALVTCVNGKMDTKGQWHVGRDSHMVVKGWAWDLHAKKPASSVWVFVDEKPLIRAAYGLFRRDLKSFRPRLKWGRTGFESIFSAKNVGPGLHEVSLKVISADGKRCMDTGTQVLFMVE
jgi:hypothetical protein